MRSQVKASSAGSTAGRGSGSRRPTLFVLAALVVAITVSLGAAAAVADSPPVVTIGGSPTAEYTTAEVSGTVNPSGGPSTTYWHFEFTTTPDDESSWQYGPSGEISGPDAEGNSPVPVNGTIEYLQPETEYSVRMVAENGEGANRVVTESPYPTFTTKGPIGKPTVNFDPVTVFTDTTAHLTGTINPNAPGDDPGFNVHYEAHCVPSCALFGGLVNPGGDVAADNSSHPFDIELRELEPNVEYSVEIVATNAGGEETAGPRTFRTEAVAPTVETIPAFTPQGGTEALLGARVNAKNSPTTYWIEYGTTTAYGTSLPATEDASAGSSGKNQILSQKITGLSPSTEYHFRAVAESTYGEVHGKDMNFETPPAAFAPESCANETLRKENNSTRLPDCRAYEQVSPVDKNGYDAPLSFDLTGLGGTEAVQTTPVLGAPVYYAAEEGSALAFESAGGFGDARASTLFNHYLSQRKDGGWLTSGLDPLRNPSPNIADTPIFSDYERKGLRYAVFTSANVGHIAPGDNATADDVYMRDNSTGIYYTLSLEESLGASGSNPSTPPYVFQMRRGLFPGLEENFTNNYVYEWDDGHIELGSIAPDGTPFPLGAYLEGWTEAAGTRQVVMKENEGSGQLFLRTVDSSGAHTVQISASRRSVPDPGGPGLTEFWGMTPDGSKVVFADTEALTDDASLGGFRALYEYDTKTHDLINLTASSIGQQTLVGMSGISADGSYVYFRSIGRYHPGENEGREAGFFVWHNGTVTQFGAPHGDLSSAEVENRPEYTGNRVSPDGLYFTFTTRHQMTAYDNTDQTAHTEGGDPKRDTEVYVYDAVRDRLTCVSCNPSGARPTGESAMNNRPQATPIQLSVLNDGRTVFNSVDALVPEDVNGRQDVYEWEDGRVRLISSGTGPFATYAAGSADGKDVYIATRDQLIPSDRDELADIYDARIDGGFPQPTTPSLCEGIEGCHGAATSAPPFTTPGTQGFSSAVKSKSPAAQRLRKALRACRHRKTKKARVRCRAAAKKRFGKASNRRAH